MKGGPVVSSPCSGSVPRGRRNDAERGSSLLGILSVVATLGILAVIVLTLNFGSSTGPVATTVAGAPATTTTKAPAPQDIASEQQVADRAACQANFSSIILAVTDYRTLNDANPPAGTTWATAAINGGPFLQSWPTQAHAFTFTWNGSTLSVVPATGAASHGSFGTVSPATGCFA